MMVKQMKANAANMGCRRLVVPIRPTAKPGFPQMPMTDYAAKRRPDGSAFDPWQRVHESLGATVVGPCERAMVIEGTTAQWEEWAGMAFDVDGEVIVPGALAPVTVDLEADLVTYVEPNLWMRHAI